MRTTFELIKATGAVLKGNRDAFPEVLKLSVNDLFFQTFLLYVMRKRLTSIFRICM